VTHTSVRQGCLHRFREQVKVYIITCDAWYTRESGAAGPRSPLSLRSRGLQSACGRRRLNRYAKRWHIGAVGNQALGIEQALWVAVRTMEDRMRILSSSGRCSWRACSLSVATSARSLPYLMHRRVVHPPPSPHSDMTRS
jgi:hypothetical protein